MDDAEAEEDAEQRADGRDPGRVFPELAWDINGVRLYR